MPEQPIYVTVCASRCLWCGRPTPHEVCHTHATQLGFDPETIADMDALWDSGAEPEPCDDPTCPVWEPGEWDRLQAEARLTPEQRRARLEQIQRGIEERRATHAWETENG